MSVLMWDKPKRVKSVEEWKDISADGAPPGVYTPNMSEDDKHKWKAVLKGKTTGFPYVEIRKTTSHFGKLKGEKNSQGLSLYAQVLITVSLGGGYPHKGYDPKCMLGVNVQISMNGQSTFSFQDMADMHEAIGEARQTLETVKGCAQC